MSDAGSAAGSRARWWREGATLLSVVGLLVALVFNTVGVWQSAEHQREARDTQQIGLLTQLNSAATDTEKAINATRAPQQQCRPRREGTLSFAHDAVLRAALDYYEYLGWLFNHRRVTLAQSRTFFGVRMIDGWRLATRYLGREQVALLYPELSRFVRETSRADQPPDLCGHMD